MDSEEQGAFGGWLKAQRRNTGRPQYEVANAAGLSASQLSRIEAGVSQPTFDTAARIAEALGISLDEMERVYVAPTSSATPLADLLTEAGMERRDALTIQNRLNSRMQAVLLEVLVAGGWPATSKTDARGGKPSR